MFNYDLNDNMVEGFVKVSITKGLVLNGKFDSWIISTPRRVEVFRQLLEYSEALKLRLVMTMIAGLNLKLKN